MKHGFLLLLIGFTLAVPSAYAEDTNQVILRETPDSLVVPSKPTPKDKLTWKTVCKHSWGRFKTTVKHLNPTAENMNDNWEFTKKCWRNSGPYLNPVCSATGILFNLNNFKIRN